LIRAWIESFTDRAELITELERVGLAWAEVRTPDTLMASPTAIAREVVAQVDDRDGGTRPVIRMPYRFSAASCEPRAGAAHVGEHNTDVLAGWLGLDDAAIAELEQAGALRPQSMEPTHDGH
jgi:CoA:oxalate CoA-transferase